jgi:hypothetical protein
VAEAPSATVLAVAEPPTLARELRAEYSAQETEASARATTTAPVASPVRIRNLTIFSP